MAIIRVNRKCGGGLVAKSYIFGKHNFSYIIPGQDKNKKSFKSSSPRSTKSSREPW